MKILLGLLLIIGGPVYGQNDFENYKRTTDSLNILYFRKFQNTGQLDKNGMKTGYWTEYKLLADSADNIIPVTVQGQDFELNVELPKPTTLQKSEGVYHHGIVNGKWKWFEAYYDAENRMTWRLSRQAQYKNGKKDGHEIEFGVFGEIYRKAEYSNDRLNGYETTYWSRDVIFTKILWKADVVQKADVFYQSGKIQMTHRLQANSLWTVTEYHENGKIKATYKENGDGKDGEYREYDDAGKLIITKDFKNGSEVEK